MNIILPVPRTPLEVAHEQVRLAENDLAMTLAGNGHMAMRILDCIIKTSEWKQSIELEEALRNRKELDPATMHRMAGKLDFAQYLRDLRQIITEGIENA